MQSLAIFAQSLATATSGKTWIFAGIALAACILGIEIACIVILIRKMLAAKRIRRAEEDEGDWGGSAYAAALLLPAITFSAETVLAALVLLCALAALLLVALVIVFRSLGYDFVSAELLKAQREKQAKERASIAEPMPEEPIPAPEKPKDEPDALAVFDAAPVEIAAETTDEETETVEAVEETVEETVAELAEETDGDGVEEPVEDLFAEETENAEESSELAAEVPDDPIEALAARMAPMSQTATGNQPTRIVQIEKQYTETVKEVAAPAAQTSGDTATDRLIEKLTDLIDKMDRKTEDAAAAAVANEESVAVSAAVALSVDEDEDEDDLVENEDEAAPDRDENDEDGDDDGEDGDRFTGNERIIGFDEATGCYIVARYRKSFEAKLIQSRPNIKQYYSELKNALLSYKGTKSRISWTADSFHNGRTSIAKINVKTRILEIYLALDPASLEGTVYRGRDVGKLKKYADTPFQYKVRTPRKFKWAMELVQRVCEEQGLTPIDLEKVDYEAAYPFEDTDSLVARGLIKEYIREEKPASTFELDENHVPVLPDEDETVIPANANIFWEFDNEELSKKEPEPIAEPAEEPASEPEPEVTPDPVAEPVADEPTVLRETTKVTQVRYTEQYFGDSDTPVTYKEYFTGDGPLSDEAIFAVASEEAEETTEAETAEVDAEETVCEADEQSDETYEESYEESNEEEADLSEEYQEDEEETEKYESDESSAEEDDLDWGIPAGLTLEADETAADLYEEEYSEEAYEGEEEYSEETYEGEEEYTEEAYEGEEEYTEEAYEGEEEYTEETYEGEEEYSEEYEEVPVEEEPTARINVNPDVALVGVGVLEENFEAGEEIDLATLKARGLVLPSAKSLKIYVGGTLTKAFTVVADQFTMEAIFAISAAGGEPQMIRK